MSKAAQILLALAHGDNAGVSESVKDAINLMCPAHHLLKNKQFEEIAKIKGVSSHLKWLTRQLEDPATNEDCYVSPFDGTAAGKLGACLQKVLPNLWTTLSGTNDTQALRAQATDVSAQGLRSSHVYHGTTSFGMTACHLLVKGEYLAMGAPAETLAGENLKQKIDGMITGSIGRTAGNEF